MIAVIFELVVADDQKSAYLDMAARLRPLLEEREAGRVPVACSGGELRCSPA